MSLSLTRLSQCGALTGPTGSPGALGPWWGRLPGGFFCAALFSLSSERSVVKSERKKPPDQGFYPWQEVLVLLVPGKGPVRP
jgi:hypothetical protein